MTKYLKVFIAKRLPMQEKLSPTSFRIMRLSRAIGDKKASKKEIEIMEGQKNK